MPEHCPTCSSVVEVVTADEGTSQYRPVDSTVTDEMVEAAAGSLWDHREREERRFHSYVDPGDLRDLRAEARAALEAALGGTS